MVLQGNSVTLVTALRRRVCQLNPVRFQGRDNLVAYVVTTLVVAAAFAATVSVKFKRSALEPVVAAEPMVQSDDLHLHLRTAPLGLPNRAKPVMRRREA